MNSRPGIPLVVARNPLLLLLLAWAGSSGPLWAVELYDGDAGPVSTHYSVEVLAGDTVYRPRVFEVAGDRYSGTTAQGRTVSFVDMGAADGERLTIQVRSLTGQAFPPGVEVRPLSYGIQGQVLEDGLAVKFTVVGPRKWLSFHPPPGSPALSGLHPLARHALLIFVSGTIPDPGRGVEVLRFGPGFHRIGHHPLGRGILMLPENIDTVVLERGAWVEGKIALPSHRPCRVLGCGVLSGQGFSHQDRQTGPDDAASMIEAWTAPNRRLASPGEPRVHLHGPMIVQSSRFNVSAGEDVRLEQLRIIGWGSDNEGIRLGTRSEALDCFVKTGDDAFQVVGSEARIWRCAVWQHGSGGCFVAGQPASSSGQAEVTILDCDVVSTEWKFIPPEAGPRAVVTVWRASGTVSIRDFSCRNIRVDNDVLRAVSAGFTDEARGTIENLRIENLTVRGRMTGDSILTAVGRRRVIRGVSFLGWRVDGKAITDADTARVALQGNVERVAFDP